MNAATERVGEHIARLGMREIVAAEIADRHFAEDVVENRRRHLDRVVTFDDAGRLEPCEGEGFNEFLERHAVLQADRDCDGEVVHQAAEGRALFMHVDEDLTEAAVFVFAGAEIDLVPADDGFLGITLAPGPAGVVVRRLFR